MREYRIEWDESNPENPGYVVIELHGPGVWPLRLDLNRIVVLWLVYCGLIG